MHTVCIPSSIIIHFCYSKTTLFQFIFIIHFFPILLIILYIFVFIYLFMGYLPFFGLEKDLQRSYLEDHHVVYLYRK